MTSQIYVDTRWGGAYGIGRYCREVTKRLSVDWSPLNLTGRPSAPLDFLQKLPKQAAGNLIYSPGYNVFHGAESQIVTVHDLIHLQTSMPGRLKYLAYYNAVLKPAILRSGTVITVSETSRQAIQEWISDDRVRVINAGIGHSSAFFPEGPALEDVEPYIIYVGNMRAHKNVGVLLRALALIDDVRLKLVLPESDRSKAERIAAEVGVLQRIDIVSGLDDLALAKAYRGAEATVMPSTLEGFGLPPLESLCCGTPVVYWAGCRSVAETVGPCGQSVELAEEPSGWAQAIEKMRSERNSVSAFDSRKFSWDRTASIVSKALSESI